MTQSATLIAEQTDRRDAFVERILTSVGGAFDIALQILEQRILEPILLARISMEIVTWTSSLVHLAQPREG